MQELTLVFDAGSTKTEVGIISASVSSVSNVEKRQIPGINPLVVPDEFVLRCLRELVYDTENVANIFFYGAGCASLEICSHVSTLISKVWPSAEVEVAGDMLGAARGLLLNRSGVACILGTGSNSALYDGVALVDNIPPLGYILGDEGSGTSLGKRLISDILKRLAPEDIRQKFYNETGLTKDMVIENVYRGETPNKFLGSMVPFIKRNIMDPYVRDLVKEVIGSFFDRNLMQYENIKTLPVNFAGSIALHFSDIVKEEAASREINIGSIVAKPMDGLIEYHMNYWRK